MTDAVPLTINVADNSAEQIAFKLLEMIARTERRNLSQKEREGWQPVDRKWILETYAECMKAVTPTRAVRKNSLFR